MRTILVAGRVGGVGTTTAAVNLAAAAAAGSRVLLIDADPRGGALEALGLTDAPRNGVWADTPGGFHAATPYGPGGGGLAASLAALKSRGPSGYDLVVIDAPPGGEALATLLHAADELVIVARAESGHFRDLPALLETVRGARRAGASVAVRGILLTLSAGVAPGGPVEAKLREKFKGLLPSAVPADPAVAAARFAGRPVVADSPAAPAARAYLDLARSLGLAAAPRRELAAVAAESQAPDLTPEDDSGIFGAARSGGVERPLSGRTETFYPDRRPRASRGPVLTLTPSPRKAASRRAAPRKRFSPPELVILGGSAAAAVAAVAWFCLG